MKKTASALISVFVLLGCSQTPSVPRYVFETYRYAHNVPLSKVASAFAHLAEQQPWGPFSGAYGGSIRSLRFEKDLQYAEHEVYHVHLNSNSWVGNPPEKDQTFFLGTFSSSAAPETKYRIQVILQCGFWGEDDWLTAAKKTVTIAEDDLCGSYEIYHYSLIYPEIDCDRGNYEMLPHDIVDFMKMALFQNMVVPIQQAMDDLGIDPDGGALEGCAWAGPVPGDPIDQGVLA